MLWFKSLTINNFLNSVFLLKIIICIISIEPPNLDLNATIANKNYHLINKASITKKYDNRPLYQIVNRYIYIQKWQCCRIFRTHSLGHLAPNPATIPVRIQMNQRFNPNSSGFFSIPRSQIQV